MSLFLRYNKRQDYLSCANKKNINKKTTIVGWVQKVRKHSNKIFISLRYNFNEIQAIIEKSKNKILYQKTLMLKSEWCISINGEIKDRVQSGDLTI